MVGRGGAWLVVVVVVAVVGVVVVVDFLRGLVNKNRVIYM